MNKYLISFLNIFIPIVVSGQGELGLSRTDIKAWYSNHTRCRFIDEETVFSIEWFYEEQLTYTTSCYFTDSTDYKSGYEDYVACDSIVEKINCHDCSDYLVKEALKDKTYQWRLIGEQQYLSRRKLSWTLGMAKERMLKGYLMRIQRFDRAENCAIITYTTITTAVEEWKALLKNSLPPYSKKNKSNK